MKSVPKCPHCGSSEINMLTDAWVVRHVVGLDADGGPVAGSEEDVQEFDTRKYECGECGREFEWKQVKTEEVAGA